jgi:hypothetical protein
MGLPANAACKQAGRCARRRGFSGIRRIQAAQGALGGGPVGMPTVPSTGGGR